MSKGKGLSAAQRDALVEALLDKYRADRATIERSLPNVVRFLESIVRKQGREGDWIAFQLSPMEEQERRKSYWGVIGKVKLGKANLSKEDGVRVLEDVAVLRSARFGASVEICQADVLKLIRLTTGLSLSTKGKARKYVVGEGLPSKSVSVVRGVILHLTSDNKLVAAEINPKELILRNRALKFVGSATDKAGDVAECHDDYLTRESANA